MAGPARRAPRGYPDPARAAKGLHPAVIAVYLRGMTSPWNPEPPPRGPIRPRDLLEFRPWMLALAVFLACALGIAVMEQFRDTGAMWAQVTPQDAARR